MEEFYITGQNKAVLSEGGDAPFPLVNCADLGVGDVVYVSCKLEGTEEEEQTANCYLAECIYISEAEKHVRVHYTNASHLTGCVPETVYTEDVRFEEDVYMVRKAAEVGALKEVEVGVHNVAPDSKEKRLAEAAEVVGRYSIVSEQKGSGMDWPARADMLARATAKTRERISTVEHAQLVEAFGDSERCGAAVDDTSALYILAKDAVTAEKQVMVDASSATVSVGMPTKNAWIVLWAVAQLPGMPALGEAQGEGPGRLMAQMEGMIEKKLAESKREQKKQLDDFLQQAMRGLIVQKAGEGEAAKAVGMAADNPGKGDCAYNVCAAIRQLMVDPNLDNVTYSKKRVEEVKQTIIENAIQRRAEIVTELGGKPAEEEVDGKMMEMLDEPLENFVLRVTAGKGPEKWGGFEAFMLFSKNTKTRVIILDARELNRKGKPVKASYEVHCENEQEKTQVAFVIWTGSHYKLGVTKVGDAKKALFNIGGEPSESEEALGLLNEFLASQVSPASICNMQGAKRTEAIKQLVQGGGKMQTIKLGSKQVSFADALTQGSTRQQRGGGQTQGKGMVDQQQGGWQQGGKRSTRRGMNRTQARGRSPSPSPAQRPRQTRHTARIGPLRTSRIPVLVVNTGASPGDFLLDLTRRDADLRRLVAGAMSTGGRSQMLLHAFPDNVAELKASMRKFEGLGLTVRAFEERGGEGRVSAAAPKKLLCEYEWRGQPCPHGTKCSKHHSQRT